LLDEINFHYAAADGADEFAILRNGHLVARASRAGATALRNDEQDEPLTPLEAISDELPDLELARHVRDCTSSRFVQRELSPGTERSAPSLA